MSTPLLRLWPVLLLFIIGKNEILASCVDSVKLDVHSVQCYGLRNGIIRVSQVFGGEKPYFYSIDGQSFSTNRVFDRLWPGAYTLYVRDASGCIREFQVVVPEPEELQVKLFSDKDTVVAGEKVSLEAQVVPDGLPLKAIEWRPPALFSDVDTLAHTVNLLETTDIAIEIRTSDGCIARDQITVYVEKTNVYFPNIIKPGSDQDAYFTLFAGEGITRIISMQVYNRGGGVVFERSDFPPNDPIMGWNGRWRNKPVQPGVYPWITIVEYLDGKRQQFHGNVTVVN
ncbi:MAG: gliding motility-associated C-terminal domain-containing protein [Saprospiraceae bacterium]|nr:gliding motility-associated C-terminal domain-containing protein [Saprospiraceae bacterium]MCB0575270.1 gliding motility-associated C-terminal domain-containing protein [Saprospiraceae bacterium]MCB9356522.1 gliding motility-associated C-terminal domain-containing protein [Lewinellaceae bacterium]